MGTAPAGLDGADQPLLTVDGQPRVPVEGWEQMA
jgi:hypothetical protein